jgi:hypothetical protein
MHCKSSGVTCVDDMFWCVLAGIRHELVIRQYLIHFNTHYHVMYYPYCTGPSKCSELEDLEGSTPL